MSASYAACVALGIVAALLVASRLPPDPAMDPRVSRAVRIAALVGGVLGAYLFELPADALGWAPPTPDGIARLGGRTVLGGVLGGWIAVDLVKARFGVVLSTGDRFAAPLAVALSFGRIGCTLAGCCPGRVVDARSTFAFLSHALHQEPARFPAAWVEACFHALAAIVLVALAHLRVLPRRHFALYCAVYALVRFGLEWMRDAPHPFAGLSYYQLLAMLLFALAVSRLVRTPDRSAAAAP